VVSRRKRANSSVANKLSSLTDRVTGEEKLQQVSGTQTNAVTNDSIALGAVNTESVSDRSITGNKIGRGEVTSDNLGVINEIVASGGLDIETGVNGHLSLSGGKYEEPYDGIESSSGYKIVAFDPTDNAVKIIDNPPVINLDDMDDVRVSGVADKQILSYDIGTTDWVPVDATLDYLSDVTVASASAGETLVYNSSGQWVDSNPPSYNYIINGAFDIWQRGQGAFTTSSGSYTADRWSYTFNVSAATMARDLAVPSAQFQYSIKFVPTSNVTSTEFALRQILERQHIQNLVGKTVTVSCWVRSSKTTVKLRMIAVGTGAGDDTVLITVSANTWTRISASFTSFVGLTAWTNAANGIGGYVDIGYQDGVAVTTSDTLFVTGVQLEEGSIATPFRRNAPSIQAELAACQRYYQRITAKQAYSLFGTGVYNSSTNFYMPIHLPVEPRTTPSFSYGGALRTLTDTVESVSALSIYTYSTTNPVSLSGTSSTSTDGAAAVLSANNDVAAYLEFNAEL
jgi:hypothetical protein